LNSVSADFPAGTIFVHVVDPGAGAERPPLLVKTKAGKYYVGPDNGVLTLVLEREEFESAWVLDQVDYWHKGKASGTFHGRDIFGPVAAHLAAGVSPDRMGTPKRKVERLAFAPPQLTGAIITAKVVWVDRYGNVVTNIPENFAPFLEKGTQIKVSVGGLTFGAPIVANYAQIPEGRYGIVINGSNLLEISLREGSAAKNLKVTSGTSIRVQR
jgi:S-adenosyl-L-methionine hydrolase (adenosine-forming)